MALILSPIAVSIGVFGAVFVVLSFALLAVIWSLYAKSAKIPDSASKIFLPVFIVFCYYMCVWIIIFGLSGYLFGSGLFAGIYLILTLPFIAINFILAFGGDYSLFPLLIAGMTVITALSVIITRAVRKMKIIYDRKIFIYLLIFVILSGIAGFQQYERNVKILTGYDSTERVEEEIYLSGYSPFSDSNELAKFNGTPNVTIDSNYPKIDGATAAYPVYAATAQALYVGLDENTVWQYLGRAEEVANQDKHWQNR